jgi:uncharacterized hydrophobic protein (TIGR00271 family)
MTRAGTGAASAIKMRDADLLKTSAADAARMRAQLFFEEPHTRRKLTRFWLLLVLAAVIASGGVVGDSTATVIGAMIVAPLMGPILGIVLAVALGDHENLIRCTVLVSLGAAAVVAIAWFLGLFVVQDVVAATSSQVAGRVSPRLVDLVVALATGAVAAIALAREDISDTLPGVAVAISLVPPLAVVGLTLESGASDEATGALLLFVTNVSAILVAGLVVMAFYRVHRLARLDGGHRPVHRARAAVTIAVALIVIAIPLAGTSARISRERSAESAIAAAAGAWTAGTDWEVISVTGLADGHLVRVTGPVPEPDPADLQKRLVAAGLGDSRARVELIPSRGVEVGSAGAPR